MKYFEVVNLVEGHGFREVPEVLLFYTIQAENETEFRFNLNEFAKRYSNDFEIYASFEDGCADIYYNNSGWKEI